MEILHKGLNHSEVDVANKHNFKNWKFLPFKSFGLTILLLYDSIWVSKYVKLSSYRYQSGGCQPLDRC